MTSTATEHARPACPTSTRLYSDGRLVAEGFPPDEVPALLDAHPRAVVWLDLCDPEPADLEAAAAGFRLHPLAIEDAVQNRQRPKLDRYDDHLFLNVYAVEFHTDGVHPTVRKTEISAFITERALITVRESPADTAPLKQRWDANARLGAIGGVAFLVHGLLDVVVDGQYAAVAAIDEAMDDTEDAILEEGGAPRRVRLYAFALRRTLAAMRRAIAPMPDIVGQFLRADQRLVEKRLLPYYRDVEDHARAATDQIDHLRERINELLEADLNEQSTALNTITRKLAAWAAIIAVPTALTGYFGQNIPFWGYGKFWGFLLSLVLIAGSATGLFLFLKRREWL